MKKLAAVFLLAALGASCSECTKRQTGPAHEHPQSSDQSVRATAVATDQDKTKSPDAGRSSCRISLPEHLTFSDCRNANGQPTLGDTCHTIQLIDPDGTDNRGACVPGPLALVLEGPNDLVRGALVVAEPSESEAQFRLRVQRVDLWPGDEVVVGDTLGQIVLEAGRPSALELHAKLSALVGRRRAEVVPEAQLSAWKSSCEVIPDGPLSFSECVFPPETHPSVPDCYAYSILPAHRDTNGELCFPGEAHFRVTGAIGYFREALVSAKVISGKGGAPESISLRVERIEEWPANELRVGDVVATVRLRGGKPVLLQFDSKLHAKTGAKQLQLSKEP